jgi:hypothetical protein
VEVAALGGEGSMSLPKGFAEAYLTSVWNAFTKGKRGLKYPLLIEADSDLYDAFLADLPALTREGGEPPSPADKYLAFKSTQLRRRDTPGWMCKIKESA